MTMWGKLFAILCASHLIEAISMITLPSVEVEKTFDKLAAKKPYLLKSPNDALLSSTALGNVEGELHGHKITEAKNLVDLAESLNLTVLVKALEETGLDNIIDHEGKYTLFAPTNEAFDHVPDWAGKIPLKELLKYHVARGLIYAQDLFNEMQVRTILSKRDIRFNIYQDGKVITANGSPITAVNYTAHNGVLHIIDRVMVSIYERDGSIVKELRRCPDFKTLSKLIAVAGLGEALHSKGPFTLFAPTDDVFAQLPADVVKHLVDNPPILRQVLLYHVVKGSWFSAGLENGLELESLQKSKLTINVEDGAVTVANATVTIPDTVASNGVIHAIGQVLLPPSVEAKLAKLMHKMPKLKGTNRD